MLFKTLPTNQNNCVKQYSRLVWLRNYGLYLFTELPRKLSNNRDHSIRSIHKKSLSKRRWILHTGSWYCWKNVKSLITLEKGTSFSLVKKIVFPAAFNLLNCVLGIRRLASTKEELLDINVIWFQYPMICVFCYSTIAPDALLSVPSCEFHFF